MNILEQEKGSSLMTIACIGSITLPQHYFLLQYYVRYFLSSLHTILYLWLNQINIQILPSRP